MEDDLARLVLLTSFVETPDTCLLYMTIRPDSIQLSFRESPSAEGAMRMLLDLVGLTDKAAVKRLVPLMKHVPGFNENTVNEMVQRNATPVAQGVPVKHHDLMLTLPAGAPSAPCLQPPPPSLKGGYPMQPVLVIMAAGMGSRYGGLKQMDPVDPAGNLIIDFSIFDALKAGFEEVIFIIKEELEGDFRSAIGDRISHHARVRYAFQRLDALPEGFQVPQGRVKPWGTTHALLCAGEAIGGRPFCAINADDYYGPTAYQRIHQYLCSPRPQGEHALVAWQLANTLTDHGSVARGICAVEDEHLTHIVERKAIIRQGDGGAFTEDGGATYTPLPGNTPVSMNFWGFGPEMLPLLDRNFREHLQAGMERTPQVRGPAPQRGAGRHGPGGCFHPGAAVPGYLVRRHL